MGEKKGAVSILYSLNGVASNPKICPRKLLEVFCVQHVETIQQRIDYRIHQYMQYK